MSSSPWALISIFPAAFQRKLGHSPSDRGHQALRYRSINIIDRSMKKFKSQFSCNSKYGENVMLLCCFWANSKKKTKKKVLSSYSRG